MSRVAFEATTGNLVVPAELRSDPRRLQQAVCSDAALLDQLLQRNPTLAEAALSDSPDLLAALLGDARDGEAAARRDDPGRERRIAAANASLARLAVSVGKNGVLRHHYKRNYRVNTRGKKFSLPKPQGGKHGDLLLREDQLQSFAAAATAT